ncbi:MAG: hypothetical protein A3G23_04055 [Bacteroidetes bacterium RIFCSPLOWO2_12_FULL_37_12]|nr:MAG: hypothetical protein A3G23_04055 [Bacteroidetes bacterium RIFCSPLOWO2_12_FULL_37_12]
MKYSAVIGCGYWGPNFIRVLSQQKFVPLKAICDCDETKLNRLSGKFTGLNYFNDYKEILNDDSITAVVVSTPVKTHYKIVKELLLHHKHVLCEKPFTYTSEEAKELIEIAKKNNLVLMVGHTFLYNTSIQFIYDWIKNTAFGNVLYVHFTRTGLGPVRSDVNVLWDLASHDISIILSLVNSKPVSVIAFGENYLQKGIDDVVFLILQYNENLIVKMHVSWLDPCKIRTMTIVGDKQMVVFDDVSLNEKVRIYDKGVDYQPRTGEFGEFQLSLRDGGISIPFIKPNEPLKQEVEHFLDCILNNKKTLTDGLNGLEVVKILEAAQKSLDNGNIKVQL